MNNLKTKTTNFRKEVNIQQILLWTYQRQNADQVIRSGAGMHELERLADGLEVQGVSSIEKIARLGTRVDTSGGGGGEIHPDAEMVHDAVSALAYLPKGLVFHFGRTGVIPDWYPGGAPIIKALLKGNGEPKMYWENGRPKWCYLDYKLTLDTMRFARKVYMAWWDGLATITERLAKYDDSLTSHTITGVGCSREPWGYWPYMHDS